MTVPNMRDAISTVYPYPKWTERVKNMPDRQVIAIYHKFMNEGKFNQSKEAIEKLEFETAIQLSIWDILKGDIK